jgi:hypothetical protein
MSIILGYLLLSFGVALVATGYIIAMIIGGKG